MDILGENNMCSCENCKCKQNNDNEIKSIILKVNDNELFEKINYCSDVYNVEIYGIDNLYDVHKKGFIYEMNDENIVELAYALKEKFGVAIEIVWNERTMEFIS